MPSQHGSKFYCQLLIDPNRYKLAEKLADQSGKKVTALLRDLVYESLERHYPDKEYQAAAVADAEVWNDSVRRRVSSRLSREG
ncbi:MAG: hypothetical protein ACO29V_05625 [Limnohabitans sp.]